METDTETQNLPQFLANKNADDKTISGFGDEWRRFDQSTLPESELRRIFNGYFAIFPWDTLPADAEGFDLGCGSGRWAKFVCQNVGVLHCIDASTEALAVAKTNLVSRDNCIFHHATVDQIPLADNSQDFGYSLGVLHHVPDTQAGIQACVDKLKPGAPFLLYLYYAFDNRPVWFRLLWQSSEVLRNIICRLPYRARSIVSQVIAGTVYWPAARLALLLERLGFNVDNLPLSAYRNRSLYSMRTDSLDRFGTRLEQRFTAAQITAMMNSAGLERITFSEQVPYWCAIGYKR